MVGTIIKNASDIDAVLYEAAYQLPQLSTCDHYAGTEKRLAQMLQKQGASVFSFDITADCEDGAAVGQEQQQLEMLLSVLKNHRTTQSQPYQETSHHFLSHTKRFGIRVHDARHWFFKQEIETLLAFEHQFDYIVLPKIEHYDDFKQQADWIAQLCQQAQKPCPSLHVIIETHGGVNDVFRIASDARLVCLSFGIMDFVSSHAGAIHHNAMQSPMQFQHPLVYRAKTQISAAAASFGKIASHNVCIALDSPEHAFNDARTAHEQFGFMRMWSIHPSQIEAIYQAFLPKPEDIDLAIAVIKKAIAADFGPIRHDNRLYDRASFRYHWQTLKRAGVDIESC
jgi:citrate lyase subunit beta/citryl-CoA lyase